MVGRGTKPSPDRPRWASRVSRSLPSFLLVIATLFFSSLLMLAYWSLNIPGNGLERCSHLYSDSRESPAGGLALSLTHATAAILWPDGSTEAVGSVRATDAYVEVMERLSKFSSRHVRPPYYGLLLGPGPEEWALQALRSARRVLGLPATSDVGMLAEPLKPLIDKINTRLQCTQSEMILVTVGVQALYDEDVEDIMRYLGLTQLPLRHYPWERMGCEQPHELASAFAAQGLGMCSTYWNASACLAEEARMPFELVLSVSHTPRGIALSTAGFRSAYMGMGYDEILSDVVGFGLLGSDSKPEFRNDAAYWEFVRTTLRTRVSQNTRWNYTRLFILDDVAADDANQMQNIMQDILSEWQPEVAEVYEDNSLFTAAIGAARLTQHGRYVKAAAKSKPNRAPEIRKRNPDPLGCPWYGSTFQ